METPYQIIEVGAGENQQIKVHNYTSQRISPNKAQIIAEQAGLFIPAFEKDYLAEFYIFEFTNGIIAGRGCLMIAETPICMSAEIQAFISDIEVVFSQCMAATISMMNKFLTFAEMIEKDLEQTENDYQDDGNSWNNPPQEESDYERKPLPKEFDVESLLDEIREDGDQPKQ